MADLSPSGNLKPRLVLYDPTSSPVVDTGPAPDCGRVVIENVQLAKSGRYTIVASGLTSDSVSRRFGLSLVLIPGPAVSRSDPNGGFVASGQTALGTIDLGGDTDVFKFYGRPGQGVVLEMVDLSTSKGLDPRIQLYDPCGIQVATADGMDRALIDRYRIAIGREGFYTAVVSDGGKDIDTGQYGLTLVLAPGAAVCTTDPDGGDIALPIVYQGELSPAGDVDIFRFYGLADQRVTISMEDLTSRLVLEPRLRLYGPNGLEIAQSEAWDYALISYRLTEPGIYTILASDGWLDVDSGVYGLTAHAEPATPAGVCPGQAVPSDGNSVSQCSQTMIACNPVAGADSYDLYLYPQNCPAILVAKDSLQPHWTMPRRQRQITYEWLVVANTTHGPIQGPVWTFTTLECPDRLMQIRAVGQGSAAPKPGQYPYKKGETVKISALPDPYYDFVRWEWKRLSEDPNLDPNVAATIDEVWPRQVEPIDPIPDRDMITVAMDDDYLVTAIFEQIIHRFTLDTDPGWKRTGLWAFGQPKGAKACAKVGGADPNTGHTGKNVFGVNLDGCYSIADQNEYVLTAGPFDLRGYVDVKLRFWRWLNSDEALYVSNSIDYSADGGTTWKKIWEYKDRGPVSDTVWTYCEYRLGPDADDKDKVYVRWAYKVLRPDAYPATGWNIDDVEISGKPKAGR